jgi:hypothetical protein
MNGLPKTTDLTFLLGQELTQVCVGVHQTILHFDGDTSITLECKFAVSKVAEAGGEACAYSRSAAVDFLKILGSRISRVTNNGNGELEIAFSDGTLVVMFDSNTNYESYQIVGPAQTIVV